MEERIKFSKLWKWFTVFPITTPPHSPLQPFCLSLSLCESISGSLKTCQMCSDQCNGLRVHYIHSAPFYEVTSWRDLPAGALCHTVNQAWQRWGGGGEDGWMKRMEVSPSSMLCLVSQGEMHCGGENTHLCIDTCTLRFNTQPALIVKYIHTIETHVCFIWKQCYLTMHKEEVCVY